MKISFLKNFIPKGKKRGNKIRPNLKKGAKEGIYGHVDTIDQAGISGWFVDLSEIKPELTVLINGIPAGKISNFFYRQDIAQLLGKYHLAGFKVNWIELNIPENLFDEQLWNVEVFYEKVNKPLAGANQIGTDVINAIKEFYKRITYNLTIPNINELKGHIDNVEQISPKILKITGWIFHETRQIKDVKLLVSTDKLSFPVRYGLERADVFQNFESKYSFKSGFIAELPIKRKGVFSLKLELDFGNNKKTVIDIGNVEVKNLYKSKWVIGENYPFANEIDDILPIFKKNREDYQNKTLPEPVDIIIPIFNGYRYLTSLFESILKNTNNPYRLIVIDDASTDYRVVNFLRELEKKLKQKGYPEFILVRNEKNLGFVASVNKGFSLSKNHMVILNSDVIVPPGWLYRLMKPIFDHPEEVASTTPFTNAGTICSFPDFLIDNDLPQNFDPVEIDNVFSIVETDKFIIELPTAIGFCMGINKYALQESGYFNEEMFGKGYGEENDWSMRAKIKGFRNILVPNLFVYHKHGGSFSSEEKERLMKENLEKLKKLHPEYLILVHDFIKEDPPKAIRDFAFLKYITQKMDTVLIIDHKLGGGANVYSKNLIKDRVKEGRCVLHYLEGLMLSGKLIVYYRDYNKEFYLENLENLKHILMNAKLNEIILNNLVSYRNPLSILEMVLTLKENNPEISLIVPVHDFYSICPSYNLLNNKGVYCDIPEDIEICQKCLKNNIYADKYEEITKWRKTWEEVLKKADFIVCFSNNSKQVLKKAYSKLEDDKFYILPHKLDVYLRKPKLKKPDKELNVGVIGNINYAKGAKVINDLLSEIERTGLNINIIVIGNIWKAFIERDYKNFKILGSYERHELPDIIERENIHLVLFPSIWPETFSYVVEECMEMGLPILAFDIGAPAERLRKYEKAQLVPVGDVKKLISKMVKFMNDNINTRVA